MLPDPIKKFVELFSGLPGIGPRQATRLAFYIKSLGQAQINEIAKTVFGLSDIQTCSQCFFTYLSNGKNLCSICGNPQRRKDLIAVVEKETDLISIENTKKFNGRYLVLGDLKKNGVLDSIQKLRLASLKKWIATCTEPCLPAGKLAEEKAAEIILAINPTTYGDINADLIAAELKDSAHKVTRLGRGIPTGGEIEFADEDTLSGALDNRR